MSQSHSARTEFPALPGPLFRLSQLFKTRGSTNALATLIGAVLMAPACTAPAAEPIQGDLSSVIQAGFDRGGERFDHSLWHAIVEKHAKNRGRRFDYAGLRMQDTENFESYLKSLEQVELATLGRAELMALFINAYNALTVKTILDHVDAEGVFAIDSIRDIGNVFDREVHTLGGFVVSLNNIEHNILRPLFKDPRVHFAVNCASISCPPLPPEAFEAERLDAQLEKFTGQALQNPDYVAIDDGKLVLTKILDWYGGDFVNPEFQGSESELASYVGKYATDSVATAIREGSPEISFRDYDWNLNKP